MELTWKSGKAAGSERKREDVESERERSEKHPKVNSKYEGLHKVTGS